jgi:hypothetical protein
MKNIIFISVILSLLIGCIKLNEFGTDEIGSNQVSSLIFQSEYTNHAWGYNHNGWIMDGTGKVKRFQKSAPWVFPDSLGYLSEKDMQKNFNVCDTVLAQVNSAEFTFYAGKALNCVNGTLTKPKNTMADAGEHINCFYIYEADNKRYKRIILSMIGDWSQENLAVQAKEVVDWMGKIK